MSQILTSVMMHLNRAENLRIEAGLEKDFAPDNSKERIKIQLGYELVFWLNENQLQDLQNRIEEVLERLEKEKFGERSIPSNRL